MSAIPHSGSPAGPLAVRGTVEGFYGRPWSHAERLGHLEFSARVGLNTYVYAPKDDPHHRARWRHPYPARELAQLAELARAATASGIRFVYAISPGLSMRYADDGDHRALAAKARQLYEAGVRSFALFFDDVPAELTRPEELERWPGAGAAGAAHGEVCASFVAGFLVPAGIREPLLVCPTDYAGTHATAYRDQFARAAPPDAVVAWTGNDIVVGAVTREDIDRAAATYQRRIVLWDNFPVNDYEPSRLFLGPLTGRTGDLAGSDLVGVLANPMVQAMPSRIPLVSVADWAADPGGYDPAASARRALATVAGAGAADLAPLVGCCAAWPPSADQGASQGAGLDAGQGAGQGAGLDAGQGAGLDADQGADQDTGLARAAGDALAGRPGGLDVLTTRLAELARGCRAAAQPRPLVSALRPWLDAGAAMAEAGLAAVRLLQAGSDAATPGQIAALREDAQLALAAAERHYADVLRSVIPPFVRDVLDRTAAAAPKRTGGERSTGGERYVLLVTGHRRSAGDDALAELLRRRGCPVRRCAEPGAEEIARSAAVVVTRAASGPAIAAVARAGVPLLAWHGHVQLGLAYGRDVLLARDRIHIVDPGDPLAAGLSGVVPVYCGAGRLTVADVGPQARVVARSVDGQRPALYHYPAGARLADGAAAPAARIGLFLGADGPAPWLMSAEGRAIVGAALDQLVGTAARPAIPRQSPAQDLTRLREALP